jgi:hypothetical protein
LNTLWSLAAVVAVHIEAAVAVLVVLELQQASRFPLVAQLQ